MSASKRQQSENNFWHDLPRPFFALAPLADVTDAAFRRLIAKYGKPDVLWTEFVSADGLCSPGRKILLHDLKFSESERPIVAQIFTGKPEKMEEAARLVADLNFDGLDINMGCPDAGVEKQGAGAALIKTPTLARELIRAAKRGVANRIPVSVKTRIGYRENQLAEWLPELLAEEPAAVTIHARTRAEMSKVPARWADVQQAVEIRNNLKSQTLIIGNGDLVDLADARERVAATGADGGMLGRAIFGNPWLFSGLHQRSVLKEAQRTDLEKLAVLREHIQLFDEILGKIKSFAIMKKHFKAYISDKNLRLKLMNTNNAKDAISTITHFLENGSS